MTTNCKKNQFLLRKVLVTGASGFIGQAVCRMLSRKYAVIVLDTQVNSIDQNVYASVEGSIEREITLRKVCNKYLPDAVVHCAGISHQGMVNKKSANLYEKINSLATEKLASAAISANPHVHFIFLSSISVYGETQSKKEVSEIDICLPTSNYAESKLSAENRLKKLYDAKLLKRLDVFRLAPVYDVGCSINLEKRVFSPKKIFYFRFGSGEQKISALARKNLVEFIDYRLKYEIRDRFCNIVNVCDELPYSFNEIIEIFQKTKYQPPRKEINIPLWFVKFIVSFMALLSKNNAAWIHSFHNKLANDLIFDNKRMLDTGFKHRLSLKTVFINNNGA